MIYFIRHGESEANARHVFAGQRDNSPLTDKGRQQALDAAAEIAKAGKTFDRIYASPLLRTRQTAEIIASDAGFPTQNVVYDPRLSEYDMGDISGKPIHNITSRELTSTADAEDPASFQERIESVLAELRALPGDTLVVSHAGVGRMIEATKRGMHPADFYSIETYPNARLVLLG